MLSLDLAWKLYFSDSDTNDTQPGWGFGLAELGKKSALNISIYLSLRGSTRAMKLLGVLNTPPGVIGLIILKSFVCHCTSLLSSTDNLAVLSWYLYLTKL